MFSYGIHDNFPHNRMNQGIKIMKQSSITKYYLAKFVSIYLTIIYNIRAKNPANSINLFHVCAV